MAGFSDITGVSIKGGCYTDPNGQPSQLKHILEKPINILFGRNGSGKSTLARALYEYAHPNPNGNEFEVKFLDEDLHEDMRKRVFVYNEPIDSMDTISLRGRELVLGNVFAWLLLHYPTAVLRPGWLNPKRALINLVPVAVVAVMDELLPVDLKWFLIFYPVVLGHEFSGDVVEVGEGVEGLSPGDTVSGAPLVPCMKCEDCQLGNFSLCRHYSFIGSREQGSFAEYVVIPAANAIKYDSSIPYEQAAMFEPSTVAVHGLLQARYRGGETVAILGCGTIGIFTLQWAKILGAKQIAAFDIDNGRLELAKRMGAHAVFNTLSEGYMEEAKAFSGGRMPDLPLKQSCRRSSEGSCQLSCFGKRPQAPLRYLEQIKRSVA